MSDRGTSICSEPAVCGTFVRTPTRSVVEMSYDSVSQKTGTNSLLHRGNVNETGPLPRSHPGPQVNPREYARECRGTSVGARRSLKEGSLRRFDRRRPLGLFMAALAAHTLSPHRHERLLSDQTEQLNAHQSGEHDPGHQ